MNTSKPPLWAQATVTGLEFLRLLIPWLGEALLLVVGMALLVLLF